MNTPSIVSLKQQAKRLRAKLAQDGVSIGHSKALELIAAQHGARDWNTLHAAAGNRNSAIPVNVGHPVAGTYLGQEFIGEVIGLNRLSSSGMYRITILFDTPVDVVTFDSFSAYRQRVTCTLDANGVSAERTSNGEPHMRLALEEN